MTDTPPPPTSDGGEGDDPGVFKRAWGVVRRSWRRDAEKGLPIWRRKVTIGAAVLLVVFVAAGIAGDDAEEDTSDPVAVESPGAEDSPSVEETSPEPPPSPSPSPSPSPTPPRVVGAPQTADASVVDWDAVFAEGETENLSGLIETYTGSGDSIVDLESPQLGASVLLQHRGSRNFQVRAITDAGEDIGLVNEIGNYQGEVLARTGDDSQITGLEIRADGEWAAIVKSVLLAVDSDDLHEVYVGTGDSLVVFPLDQDDPQPTTIFDRAQLTHDGDRNFIVRELLGGGLVNEIGPYEGTVRLSGRLYGFEITADGRWTIGLQ